MNDPGLTALFRRSDPPPESALRAAFAAIEWLNADTRLAALEAESADPGPAPARGVSPRRLTFGSGGTVVGVEVSSDEGKLRIHGRVDPPGVAVVVVESAGESTAAGSDERGRFSVGHPLAARVRLRVGFDGRALTTEWFRP